jgi:hypothetical protein
MTMRRFLAGLLATALGTPAFAADVPVDFTSQIKPLLQTHCGKCHTGDKRKAGLSFNTRKTLLAGGETGPAAVPGQSAQSLLIERVTAKDPDVRMPPGKEPLTARQIDFLRQWIDQGLAWEDGFSFGRHQYQPPLLPRRPTLPPASADASNPIDRALQAYQKQNGISFREPVSDRIYARRVFLDLVGLLPTPNELQEFEADADAGKRERLVDRLLADRRAYADHWLSFWNDALRNDYQGTGYIDNGRRQITGWLYRALYESLPYDRFVHDLVSPVAGSEGFTLGIKWRGVVNESQRREIQAAQNITQVFLGSNLKCASCHDSFVNDWKLADAYALASVFADKPLLLHRCDKPTGKTSAVGFLYPELGTVDARAAPKERVKQLADLLVKPEDGRLARTIVNRLWARLLGRGLVEPVDDLDARPWDADLLDFLASDLADHGYNLKRTLRLIATSRAYQLPSVSLVEVESKYVFRGPVVKRMTAEQFTDAIAAVTGVRTKPTDAMLKVDDRGQGGQVKAAADALGPARSKGATDAAFDTVRAALTPLDPLQAALGRPSREQVVTSRESNATLLQALELTNGATLDALLQKGAARWVQEAKGDAGLLIDQLYLTALGRKPTGPERAGAEALAGKPMSPEGVADLLWVLTMLPEFQLID